MGGNQLALPFINIPEEAIPTQDEGVDVWRDITGGNHPKGAGRELVRYLKQVNAAVLDNVPNDVAANDVAANDKKYKSSNEIILLVNRLFEESLVELGNSGILPGNKEYMPYVLHFISLRVPKETKDWKKIHQLYIVKHVRNKFHRNENKLAK